MKKVVLFLVLLCYQLPVYAFPKISSQNVYFYQFDHDEVLYTLKSDEEIAIASLTKIMTASVALDLIEDLDATITFESDDRKGLVEAHASRAGFQVGEKVTYRDLLYGLLLPSGADAALALSNHLVGSEKEFVKLMNEKAERLGLKHTHFVNTTGLDIDNHYSTLEDVAVFLKDALNVTSNKKHTFKSSLVKSASKSNIDVSYILGSKTGYTDAAGLCLASLAEHDGNTYLLITALADYQTSRPEHIIDSTAIYRYFFDNYEYKILLKEGEVLKTVMDENGKKHDLRATKTIEQYLPKDTKVTYEYQGETSLPFGMSKGDKIGEYQVLVDGEVVDTESFYVEEDILKPFPWEMLTMVAIIAVICVISIFALGMVVLLVMKVCRRKKRTS